MALSQDQIRILAQTLLGEAGGEGLDGMKAVAHVLRNRAASPRFPNDPVSVALQPQQFSTWNTGEGGNNPGRFGPGSPGYDTAVQAIEAVFNGNEPDPTGGATHYWSPRGMPGGRDPYWAGSEQTEFGRLKIGNHVFLPRQEAGQATQTASQAIDQAIAAPQRPETTSAYASPVARPTALPAMPTPPERPVTAPAPPPRPVPPSTMDQRAGIVAPQSTIQLTEWNEDPNAESRGFNPVMGLPPQSLNLNEFDPTLPPQAPVTGPATRSARGVTPPSVPPTPPDRPRAPQSLADPLPFPFPQTIPSDITTATGLANAGFDVLPGYSAPPAQVAQAPVVPPAPVPPMRPPSGIPPQPMATYSSTEVGGNPLGPVIEGARGFMDNGGVPGMVMNMMAGKGALPGDQGVIPQWRGRIDAGIESGQDPLTALFTQQPYRPPMFSQSQPQGYSRAVDAVSNQGAQAGFLSTPDRVGNAFERMSQGRGVNDIMRANAQALGGRITQDRINEHLASGGTLYRARDDEDDKPQRRRPRPLFS